MDKTIQDKLEEITLVLQDLSRRVSRIEAHLSLEGEAPSPDLSPAIEDAVDLGLAAFGTIGAISSSEGATESTTEEAQAPQSAPEGSAPLSVKAEEERDDVPAPKEEDAPIIPDEGGVEPSPAAKKAAESVSAPEDDLPFIILDGELSVSPEEGRAAESAEEAPGQEEPEEDLPPFEEGSVPVQFEGSPAVEGEQEEEDLPVAASQGPTAENAVETPQEPTASEAVEEAPAPVQDTETSPEEVPQPKSEEEEEEDMPLSLFEEIAPAPTASKKRGRPRKNINEALAAQPTISESHLPVEAWRTDRPGPEVKNIRSAIALVDRVIFINSLFGGNAIVYTEVLDKINSMSTLDEVVAFLREKYPDWDMNGEEQYKFMMAVRRKIRK